MWVNIIIVMAILGTAAILGYVATKPRAGEALPEFYILGQESTSGGYPSELVLGEEGRVMVSIVNHDYEIVSYRVEVEIDGVKNNEVKGIMLKHGEGWKQEVSFVPLIAGEKQEVQFLLYKNEDSEPCLKPLHLWLNVKEKPSE